MSDVWLEAAGRWVRIRLEDGTTVDLPREAVEAVLSLGTYTGNDRGVVVSVDMGDSAASRPVSWRFGDRTLDAWRHDHVTVVPAGDRVGEAGFARQGRARVDQGPWGPGRGGRPHELDMAHYESELKALSVAIWEGRGVSEDTVRAFEDAGVDVV